MSEKLAWAAGFFDGEGSTYVVMPSKISFGKQRKTAQIVMKIGQEHARPLYRFQSSVGFGTVRGPHQGRHGSKYTWAVWGRLDVGDVVKKLWPYLCDIKRQQILDSIEKFLSTPHSKIRIGVAG